MVYLMCEDLGWRPFVKSWIEEHFAGKEKIVKKAVVKQELEELGINKE